MRFKKPIYFIFTALFLSGCSNPITNSSKERGHLNSNHYYDVVFDYELNADRNGYVLKKVNTSNYYGPLTISEFYQGLPIVEIGNECFSGLKNLTEIHLPNTLKTISQYAFYCCDGITSFTIPDSVTHIGAGAFSTCASLRSINLGSGVKSIENYNFIYNSKKLETITVKEDNTYFSSENGLLYSLEDDSLFATAPGLSDNLSIKEGTKRIKKGAFYALDLVRSVTIPASVEIIDDETFHGFLPLRTINVVSSNQYFTSIDGVLYDKEVTNLICYPASRRASSFIAPDSLKNVGKYSFGYCKGLEELTLPEGLENIGEGAFRYAEYLKTINIPSTLVRIEDYAFYNCDSLRFISLSSKLTVIRPNLFGGCSALTSIILPKTLLTIRAEAFKDCWNLRDVYFEGTEEEFDSIAIDKPLTDYFGEATKYFYSETNPSTTGNYWRYRNGEPAKW